MDLLPLLPEFPLGLALALAGLILLCVTLQLSQGGLRRQLDAARLREERLLARLERVEEDNQGMADLIMGLGERLQRQETGSIWLKERLVERQEAAAGPGAVALPGNEPAAPVSAPAPEAEEEDEQRAYDEAIAMAREGGSAEEIVRAWGLSRGEADLIVMMHGARAA